MLRCHRQQVIINCGDHNTVEAILAAIVVEE